MLLTTTIRAALLVAAGESAAVTTPAAILMKGVLRAMFLQKLKIAVAAVMTAVALGAGGIVYQAGAGPNRAEAQTAPAKPRNELEALRKENELLKLNLQVVLEKVRAQEEQLRALKQTAAISKDAAQSWLADALKAKEDVLADRLLLDATRVADPLGEVMAALKAYQDAKDPKAKAAAAAKLENASRKLREQLKGQDTPKKK